MRMQLNEAVSKRLTELLSERNMTQYQLFMKSGVPKSTIGNVINCSYESVKLRIVHEMCQGLGITLCDFFQSPLFDDYHLDPKLRYNRLGCTGVFLLEKCIAEDMVSSFLTNTAILLFPIFQIS